MNISTSEVSDIKKTDNPGTIEELLRQAAELGPGFRGRKRHADEYERGAMAAEFRQRGEEPPPYLEVDPTWIERRAKLFECGDYPDKGLTVTAIDLERLAANFDSPVPILIKHAESPLEIGYLTEVSAEDGELFGLIALSAEANALIERSGAKSLSVGLTNDLDKIREVSLVRNPRVASAQIFHCQTRFETDLDFGIDWRRKYEDAQRERRLEKAEERVRHLVSQGRITPAQAPYASALLMEDSDVRFDGGLIPVRDLVAKLIAAQPLHGMFGEYVHESTEEAADALLLPEEAGFYRKHFPNVSLDAIAQKRNSRGAALRTPHP